MPRRDEALVAQNAKQHRSVARIFAVPLALNVMAAIGLASALFGDGLFDVLSWIFLGSLLVVCVIFAVRQRPDRNHT